MTNLPLWRTTAGLNVPADCQVVPSGERIGWFERRGNEAKGGPGAAGERRRKASQIRLKVRVRIRKFSECKKEEGVARTPSLSITLARTTALDRTRSAACRW